MRVSLQFLVLTCILGACNAAPREASQNIVMFDSDGEPVDPTENNWGWLLPYDRLGPTFDTYMENNVFAGLRKWVDDGHPRRVVIFIHGGLNNQSTGVERAVNLTCRIEQDSCQPAYPIFVNWQSSLISSYRDHLLFIRRGNDFGALGTLLAPFYLAADLGRIVVRAPIVTIEGLWRTTQTCFPNATKEQRVTARTAATYVQNYQSCAAGSFPIYAGTDYRSGFWESLWKGTKCVLTLPPRLVATPIVDGIGAGAWDVMQRRVDLLIETEKDSHQGYSTPGHRSGLLAFFERLQDFVQADGQEWQIVLIGHSMGAMVINRVLTHGTHGDVVLPEFDDIVYMAPACTLGEFEKCVLPYLAARNCSDPCDGRSACNFWLLTLPLKSEIGEENFPEAFGLAPRGSLLLWIDDYFSQPNSEVDHTLGRFSNLIAFFHRIPADLVPYFHVKAFDHGAVTAVTNPQKHGDFDDFPFWRRDFWNPCTEGSGPCRLECQPPCR